MAGFVTVNQLAGPPIGAALFALGSTVPFVAQAVLVAAGAGLVSRIVLPRADRSTDRPTHIRHDIAENEAKRGPGRELADRREAAQLDRVLGPGGESSNSGSGGKVRHGDKRRRLRRDSVIGGANRDGRLIERR